MGALEFRDIELLHLQHGFGRARGFRPILVGDELEEHAWYDLPRKSEAILQPAALAFHPTIRGQLRPQPVDFLLTIAPDHEGNGLGELEKRPAVEGSEALSAEREGYGHHPSWRSARDLLANFAVARDALDCRVIEQRDIKLGGLLGLLVKPQERRDLLAGCDARHGASSSALITVP